MGKKTMSKKCKEKQEDKEVSGEGRLPSAKSQSEIRKRLLLREIQSKPVRVLVGRTAEAFNIPEGLLVRHSPVFKRMLHGPFKESTESLVELPEDSVAVFEDFLVWACAQSPRIPEDAEMDSLARLAVFAEKYLIYLLKNQTSDRLRAALNEGKWELTLDAVCVAYEGTPTNSTLRQLLSLAFAANAIRTFRTDDGDKWKPIFVKFADFGWDYFEHTRNLEYGMYSTPAITGEACRFHDHSDIPGWVREDPTVCPYPEGGPVEFIIDDENFEPGSVGDIESKGVEWHTSTDDLGSINGESSMPLDLGTANAEESDGLLKMAWQ